MAYNYRKVQRKILAGDEKGVIKTYGVAKATGICDMIKLCRLISARSAISSAEVKSVLDNLLWAMEVELQSGNLVRLKEFGSFKITISTRGSQTEKEFSASNIRRSRLVFTPGPQLRAIAANVTFSEEEVRVKEIIHDEPCPYPHEG